MTTLEELKAKYVRRPKWVISDHAYVRWAERWRDHDMMSELEQSKTLGKSEVRAVRSKMPTGRSPRHVYLRSPCGAVFVLARDDLRTVVTVLPG